MLVKGGRTLLLANFERVQFARSGKQMIRKRRRFWRLISQGPGEIFGCNPILSYLCVCATIVEHSCPESEKNIMRKGNIYSSVPDRSPEEIVETSVRSGRVKIQRIISDAHCSPEEFWYDQVEREFVSPLQHSTELYDPQTKDLMGEDRSFDMVKCFLTNAAEGRLPTTAM